MLREIVRADLKKENDIRALFRSIVKTRPEVLDDVRIFTIHHHQPGRCQALGVPFQLNNLHTLRIDATSHSRSEPAPTAFTWWRVAPWQERQCKYMKHLEPKSLVLRNATLAKINFISFGLSTKVAETIEELVMISDLSESTDKKHDCIGPCRITSMPKLRRFMWIFRPSNDGAEFCSDITYPTGQHSMPHICALFSVIIELKEVEFIFVNTGEIRHHVSDSAWWTKTGDEFQKEVENYWRTKIDLTGRKKGWTKRDLEEKHELVRFCSLEDWMDEVGSGWRDVLSEKEVGEWSEK
nr:uncharacterized protein CI109_003990 [Kwoniella shandongensis]KAA5527731.1 hypothetical protein CI109_003990 [Kwoniella shandongensis]